MKLRITRGWPKASWPFITLAALTCCQGPLWQLPHHLVGHVLMALGLGIINALASRVLLDMVTKLEIDEMFAKGTREMTEAYNDHVAIVRSIHNEGEGWKRRRSK